MRFETNLAALNVCEGNLVADRQRWRGGTFGCSVRMVSRKPHLGLCVEKLRLELVYVALAYAPLLVVAVNAYFNSTGSPLKLANKARRLSSRRSLIVFATAPEDLGSKYRSFRLPMPPNNVRSR